MVTPALVVDDIKEAIDQFENIGHLAVRGNRRVVNPVKPHHPVLTVDKNLGEVLVGADRCNV